MPVPEIPNLDYIDAKLERARTKLKELKDGLDEFDAAAPFELHYSSHPLTGGPVCRVSMRRPFVTEWRLLVSEFSHHARTALDQMVTQLVVANGGSADSHRGGFPVSTSEQDYRTPRGRRPSYRDESLKGVAAAAVDAVDQLQPFHADDPFSHPLALLNVIANGEKHRVGQPSIALLRGTAIIHKDDERSTINVFGNESPRDNSGRRRIQDGSDLWSFVSQAEVVGIQRALVREGRDPDLAKLTLWPRLGVAFDAGAGRDVLYPDLASMLDQVADVVLVRLRPFIADAI